MDLGSKLKEVRRSKVITLQEVARETGLSKSFISQVEAGDANPSIASLKKIADVLAISLAVLFQDEEDDAESNGVKRSGNADQTGNDVRIVRSTQRKMLVYPGQKAAIYLLSPDVQRKLEVITAEFEPGHDTGLDMYSHQGEECGLVVEGTLEVTVNGEVFVLEAGDSIYFSSHYPHRLRVLGEKAVTTFWVNTPPTY
jgi:transcriptional regulator with XRE-family HTH domain